VATGRIDRFSNAAGSDPKSVRSADCQHRCPRIAREVVESRRLLHEGKEAAHRREGRHGDRHRETKGWEVVRGLQKRVPRCGAYSTQSAYLLPSRFGTHAGGSEPP